MAGDPLDHRLDDRRRRVDRAVGAAVRRRAQRQEGIAEWIGAACDRRRQRSESGVGDRRSAGPRQKLYFGRTEAAVLPISALQATVSSCSEPGAKGSSANGSTD